MLQQHNKLDHQSQTFDAGSTATKARGSELFQKVESSHIYQILLEVLIEIKDWKMEEKKSSKLREALPKISEP